MEDLWIKTKDLLKENIKPHQFSLWIDPIMFLEGKDSLLILSVSNQFSLKRIEENYLQQIKEIWKDLTGNEIEVSLVVKKQRISPSQAAHVACVPKTEFNYNSKNPRPLRESFSFETFVTGPQNIVAFQAAKAIASSENGNVPNGIILLLSPNGLGKTHLSQSAVALRNKKYPQLKVFYLTVQDFTDMMTKAMRTGGNFEQKTQAVDNFKQGFINADLLVFDEIDHLPGKTRTQKEIAFIIDHLMDRGKKIIYCSNTNPAEIKGIDGKIKSLLGMAPVIEIEPPDHQTRTKIFLEKSALWTCPISENIASYLAEKVRNDVRKIEGVLSRLMLSAQAHQRTIDMQFVRQALEKILLNQEGVTPDFIFELVSRLFNISVADIKSKSRKQNIVWPRYVAIHLILKYCKLTHETIGELVNKSHSIISRVPEEISKHIADRQKKLQLDHVETQLKKRLGA